MIGAVRRRRWYRTRVRITQAMRAEREAAAAAAAAEGDNPIGGLMRLLTPREGEVSAPRRPSLQGLQQASTAVFTAATTAAVNTTTAVVSTTTAVAQGCVEECGRAVNTVAEVCTSVAEETRRRLSSDPNRAPQAGAGVVPQGGGEEEEEEEEESPEEQRQTLQARRDSCGAHASVSLEWCTLTCCICAPKLKLLDLGYTHACPPHIHFRLHALATLAAQEEVTRLEVEKKRLEAQLESYKKKKPRRQDDEIEARKEFERTVKQLISAKQDLLELKGVDYMTGRSEVVRPLEDTDMLGQPPFECFPVLSGQVDAQVKVGSLKTLVNVSLYSESLPPQQQKLLDDLQEPAAYVVRLYVLRAGDLPERSGDKPDPFMRAKLGKQTLGSRKDAMSNTTEPAFFKIFTFKTTLPGESVVRLEVVDHNSLNFDEVIGYTEIDLEDRIFSDRWKAKCYERPPVERRPLMVEEKTNPQVSVLVPRSGRLCIPSFQVWPQPY